MVKVSGVFSSFEKIEHSKVSCTHRWVNPFHVQTTAPVARVEREVFSIFFLSRRRMEKLLKMLQLLNLVVLDVLVQRSPYFWRSLYGALTLVRRVVFDNCETPLDSKTRVSFSCHVENPNHPRLLLLFAFAVACLRSHLYSSLAL